VRGPHIGQPARVKRVVVKRLWRPQRAGGAGRTSRVFIAFILPSIFFFPFFLFFVVPEGGLSNAVTLALVWG